MSRHLGRMAWSLALACAVAAAETKDLSLEKEVEHYLATASPAAESGPPELKGVWKDGPRWTSADGNFAVALVGRLHADSFWISSDEFDAAVTEDGTFFRRVRLGAQGTVYKNVEFKIELDFAKSTPVLTDVFVGLRGLGALGTLRVGHMREPFTLEVMESSNDISVPERAAAVEAFAPFRNVGIALSNAALEDRLTWSIGLFRNTDDQGQTREDGGYSVTLRVTGLPVHDRERGLLVHVGGGASLRDPDDETVRYQARPGVGTGPRLVDTGDIKTADGVLLLNAELAVAWNALSFQGEFIVVEVDGTAGSPGLSFGGWYVQVAYTLTGEPREYKAKTGVFGSPKPKRNFRGESGGWGAFELVARLDRIDLDDGAITGGEQETAAFGLNWYLNPNTRVMFHILFTDVDAATGGDLTTFLTRFQFNF